MILIATGSEVHLAVDAYEELLADGVRARVVSLPSWYLFDNEPEEYRESVLPESVAGAGRGRAGLDPGLGPLRRPAGQDRRHAHLRGLGAAEGGPAKVRLHSRPRRRGGEGAFVNDSKPTQRLHELGQSLWVDNIDRQMLSSGVLRNYIDELSVTGLTSNPTIFDNAIGSGSAYDDSIRALHEQGRSDEDLFFELALEDLRQAADLFVAAHERTDGVDGWVSLEVSPLIADDTEATIEQAERLHIESRRNNIFIKIPERWPGPRRSRSRSTPRSRST